MWDKCKSTIPCQSAKITMVMSFSQRLNTMASTEQIAEPGCNHILYIYSQIEIRFLGFREKKSVPKLLYF